MYKKLPALTLLTLLLAGISACAKKTPDAMIASDKILNDAFIAAANTQTQVDKALSAWEEGKGDAHAEAELLSAQSRLEGQIKKIRAKLENDGLAAVNQRSIQGAMEGHTKVYKFKGAYKVMVIPVQFSDAKMEDISFYSPDAEGNVPAQEYLFGEKNPNSLHQYYKHASLGQLNLNGEVTPVVTVDNPLSSYGEAVPGSSDKNARGLVVDVLARLKELHPDKDWWDQFDEWDLSDYDKDGNFHEQDGFVDAVVLIYAGKSQASCQADFDTEGTRPASADVPPGPRYLPSVECYNRIWPHRWSISLAPTDPRYSEQGPLVEGRRRPSMNGFKIHDGLFATDYNMQSEFSDLSTFMHEFGHSLTLPDVYSKGASNSTGSWELMSNNAPLYAQEFSTYSKVSLGWLSPKIIRQGETTSAYLGAYNFVSEKEREDRRHSKHAMSVEETLDGKDFNFDVLSLVPGLDEPVYRSIIVLTNPSQENVVVTTPPPSAGHRSAYSGRFDGESRSFTLQLEVPKEGDATLSFDTFYQIETETNFLAKGEDQAEIKVTVDYDLGEVKLDGKTIESLRLVSGDNNNDTLNENLPGCKASEVLALRGHYIKGELSKDEEKQFVSLAEDCQKPSWVKKSYDLSQYRGREVTLQVTYTTDAGYTELGIILDNLTFAGKIMDFENDRQDSDLPGQEFKLLVDGSFSIFHSQFYMLEYRTPGEVYKKDGSELSYNMDNNIQQGEQSFFTEDESSDLRQRFRLVEYSYRPGVLVWYFNSKYGRTDNDPSASNGKGYLLVLNSKVKEVPLPSVLGKSELFDENGYYDSKSEAFKNFSEAQNDLFVCAAFTSFYKYTQGEEAKCDDVKDLNFVQKLILNGRPLIYRREGFNQILPQRRVEYKSVGNPLRRGAAMRTGLSTFNPADSAPFAAFKVYKEHYGQMVLDQTMTASAPVFPSVSSFDDALNVQHDRAEFKGDSVVVEKTGFSFEVVTPSQRVLARYKKDASAEDESNYFRRPRAKIYFNWK